MIYFSSVSFTPEPICASMNTNECSPQALQQIIATVAYFISAPQKISNAHSSVVLVNSAQRADNSLAYCTTSKP